VGLTSGLKVYNVKSLDLAAGGLTKMKVGITLPQIGQQATPENLLRVAERAEELGYDSLWVLERLLWPISPQEPYPATADGLLPEAYQNVLDPLETLAFAAAHTKKVRLATSVIVLPYHTPVELARRIATLDVLSSGRVSLGVGVGWSHDEFQAVGTPFERRGPRADEFLRALIDIWTTEPVAFEGEFYRIPESKIGPKPVQKPHPPIYVAGFGQPAHERAARVGSGWNPSGLPSFEWLEGEIKQFHEACARAGRQNLEVVLRASPVVFDKSSGASRNPLMGTLDEIREDLQRLADIGVTEIIHTPPEIGFIPTPEIGPGLKRLEQLIEVSR
jgi:probable F420-dependent oxidoreductase